MTRTRSLTMLVLLSLPVTVHADWTDWRNWLGSHGTQAPRSGVVELSGHIEARDHRVSCKVGGTLESLSFEEGDRVKAGQVLAQLDPTDTRLALAVARAERSGADAELRLRLAGSRSEDIAEARSQVKRAEVDLQGADRELARESALLARGSGVEKARDEARTRRDAAAWTLAAARDRLRKLEAGSRPEELDFAKARLAAADARLAQLEQQLRDATVTSPIDGLVTEKLAEKGELASRGTAVAVVIAIDSPWLTVYVAEPDLDRIRLGQEAPVLTDGGHARTGRIGFIASEAEFTPKNVQTRDERVKLVFKVKLFLENRDGLFKPGMPAVVRFSSAGGPR